MATKTITVDMEAYGRLKAVQKDAESFSQVIKRVVRRPLDVRDFRKRLGALSMSDEAASAIEAQVRRRRRPSSRSR